jgi:hypothetical protein
VRGKKESEKMMKSVEERNERKRNNCKRKEGVWRGVERFPDSKI